MFFSSRATSNILHFKCFFRNLSPVSFKLSCLLFCHAWLRRHKGKCVLEILLIVSCCDVMFSLNALVCTGPMSDYKDRIMLVILLGTLSFCKIYRKIFSTKNTKNKNFIEYVERVIKNRFNRKILTFIVCLSTEIYMYRIKNLA